MSFCYVCVQVTFSKFSEEIMCSIVSFGGLGFFIAVLGFGGYCLFGLVLVSIEMQKTLLKNLPESLSLEILSI